MITIRKATTQDAQEIADIYQYYVLNTAITFETEVPSVVEIASRIKNTLLKYPYYVAIDNNKIVGYAYAGTYKGRAAYDWGCELSIYTALDVQSKGIGSKLYQQLINTLKQMNIKVVYACIAIPNEQSVGFHQRNGFKQVALFEKCGYKFDKWQDMIWMEKRIDDSLIVEPIKWINEI